MSNTSIVSSGAPLPPYTNGATAAAGYPPGTPVAKKNGSVQAGLVNAAANATIIGLTSHQSSAGERVFVQFGGLLTLSPDEWDVITGGAGGLIEGVQYYLKSTGKLSITPPTGGDFIAPVGIAWSSRTMLILPQAPFAST